VQVFGGISAVLFADLLQLPPVKGNQPFNAVTFLKAKQRLGATASINLWKTFHYEELTINTGVRELFFNWGSKS